MMNWEKQGQIFSFKGSFLEKEYISHSQSPQAVVFDDYVRVYFSTRKKSENGKILSYVQFVDFDKSFRRIVNHSTAPVVSLGKLGCFDEHGIFPMSPTLINDRFLAYTTGWTRRKSVSVTTGIGLVTSYDKGLTFKKHGDGPVLTASLNEPFLVCDGFVRKYNDLFHMWYIYGKAWKRRQSVAEPERTYVIGHAISDDGYIWEKEGRQVIPTIGDDECQALPTVIQIDSLWHMYFCYRSTFDFRTDQRKSYKLGYAYTRDLMNWTRDDTMSGIQVSEDGWDSEMMCYPNIFEMDGEIYLLYNGNGFGENGFGVARILRNH